MQTQINELELHLTQCRAAANAAQKERDEVSRQSLFSIYTCKKEQIHHSMCPSFKSKDKAKDAGSDKQFKRGLQSGTKQDKVITWPRRISQGFLLQRVFF